VDVRSWDQKITDPGKRFVVLAAFNNEAVLDKETQLVWMRQFIVSPGGPVYLYQASEACHNANAGGRRGWRLPYVHEVTSLFDGDSIPSQAFGYPIPSNTYVWTLTHKIGLVAWTAYFEEVNLASGATRLGAPDSADIEIVLCVRGHGAQP
jgi:hypothetical protein